MPRPQLSRRAFLAAAGGAIAGLALPRTLGRTRAQALPPAAPSSADGLTAAEWDFVQPRPVRLDLWGRTTATTAVRESAALNQTVVEWLHPNTVLPLFEKIHAEGSNPNNPLWYRVRSGFVYTSTIQPIKPYHMPHEIATIDTLIGEEPGFWAEVIVPYSLARTEPSGPAVRLEDDSAVDHFYSAVHRVIDAELDGAGYLWYKVYDDKKNADPVYILARHMRALPREAFEPINPGANKRIVVTLAEQRIDCYEDDRLVYSTLTSSGGGGWDTPKGEHAVVYKQPSRHMYSDPEQEAFSDPDFFDLPGVPYNIFFTTMGHAIHGTYWHGDYGRPRSHGCLNVSPEAAHWIFRWVEPLSPYEAEASGSSREPGTPVSVV
jgi:lipoprotein-anchoring transpeptidase ErfK/SrfK